MSDIQRILELLDTYEAQYLPQDTTQSELPNYNEIKNKAMQRELQQALTTLRQLTKKPKEFKHRFKQHCARRADNLKDTSLSFKDYPNSVVNQLYWQVANIKFKPTSLAAILAILLPDIQYVVDIHLEDYHPELTMNSSIEERRMALHHYRHHASPVIVITPLSHYPLPLPKSLERFSLTTNTILNIDSVIHFGIGTHIKLYQLLRQNHPDLAASLYEHNMGFLWLAQQLDLLEKARSPHNELVTFIRELRLGSSSYTGEEEASDRAKKAYEYFKQYYQLLALDIRQKIDKLTTSTGTTFADVMEDLHQGRCVETAANALEQIISSKNSEQQKVLHVQNKSNVSTIKNLIKNHLTHLSAIKEEQIVTLPTHLIQDSFKKITIIELDDLIFLLVNLPTAHYSLLFQQATFLDFSLKKLIPILKLQLLNASQILPIYQAIADNYQRFHLKEESLLNFAINLGQTEAIDFFFQRITNEKTRYHVISSYQGYWTPSLFETCLNFLSSDKFKLAVYNKNKSIKGLTEKTALFIVFRLLSSDKERLTLIIPPGMKSNIPLHHYTYDVNDTLSLLKTLQHEESRLKAISYRDNTGKSLLDYLWYNDEKIEAIFNMLLSDEEKLTVMIAESSRGTPFLHCSYPPKRSVYFLQALEHEESRLKAISYPDKEGNNLLHHFSYSPTGIKAILKTISSNEAKIQLILTKNTEGETLLDKTRYQPKINRFLTRLMKNNNHSTHQKNVAFTPPIRSIRFFNTSLAEKKEEPCPTRYPYLLLQLSLASVFFTLLIALLAAFKKDSTALLAPPYRAG